MTHQVAGAALRRSIGARRAQSARAERGDTVAGCIAEQATVGLRGIGGAQERDVAIELDATLGIPRRQGEVDDAGVVVVVGIDDEVEDALEELIRSDVAKRLTSRKRTPVADLKLSDWHEPRLYTLFEDVDGVSR